MSREYRDELRDDAALEAIEACYIYGYVVKYQDRATESPTWIWCIPEDTGRDLMSGKGNAIEEELTMRRFFIPRQVMCGCKAQPNEFHCCKGVDIFPPRNRPSTYSIISDDHVQWAMDSYEADELGVGYTLITHRHQPRRVEVR